MYGEAGQKAVCTVLRQMIGWINIILYTTISYKRDGVDGFGQIHLYLYFSLLDKWYKTYTQSSLARSSSTPPPSPYTNDASIFLDIPQDYAYKNVGPCNGHRHVRFGQVGGGGRWLSLICWLGFFSNCLTLFFFFWKVKFGGLGPMIGWIYIRLFNISYKRDDVDDFGQSNLIFFLLFFLIAIYCDCQVTIQQICRTSSLLTL